MSKTCRGMVAVAVVIGVVSLNLVHAGDGTGPGSPLRQPTPIDPTLAAELQAIEQQPTLPASALPPRSSGTFFSAQHPLWPPFPGNIGQFSLWDLGGNTWLLDDVTFDYAAQMAAAERANGFKAEIAHSPTGGGVKPRGASGNLPVLVIGTNGPGTLVITVTNALSPENYELYWTPVLASAAYPWQAIAVGATGQTNFSVNATTYPIGFFKVNWDTNTIPLWKAADPNNQATGVLNVWIDSPANGATLN